MLLCGSFFLLPLHTLFLLFLVLLFLLLSFASFFPLSSFSSSFSFLSLLLFFSSLSSLPPQLEERADSFLFYTKEYFVNTLLELGQSMFSITSVNIFQIVSHQHYLCQNHLLLT